MRGSISNWINLSYFSMDPRVKPEDDGRDGEMDPRVKPENDGVGEDMDLSQNNDMGSTKAVKY